MIGRAIVGVDDVAGGAAAGAIIAGLVVGARQVEEGIEETRFLQAEENGIGAQLGAETAIAELVVRAAGFFLAIRIADLALLFAAALENAQDVAGLRNFPALERREFREDSLRARFLGRRRWDGEQGLWCAVGRIAFAEVCVFSVGNAPLL